MKGGEKMGLKESLGGLFGKPTAETWYNKGEALYEKERREEAIECYNKALELSPRSATALISKGHCLSELGRLEEALRCYEEGLRLTPGAVGVWLSKAGVEERLGRRGECIISFRQYLTLAVDQPPEALALFVMIPTFHRLFFTMPQEVQEILPPHLREAIQPLRSDQNQPVALHETGPQDSLRPSPQEDPFRAALFADQDLDTLLFQIDPGEGSLATALEHLKKGRGAEAVSVLEGKLDRSNPWELFALASALRAQGKDDEARRTLLSVLQIPEIESRVKLWACHALRELGESPPPHVSDLVMGIVFEVPLEMGVDILAAYQDGSARYVNQGGSIIVWDAPRDDRFAKIIRSIMSMAQEAVHQVPLQDRHLRPVQQGNVRFNLLTPGGIHLIEERLDRAGSGKSNLSPLFSAGTELMVGLVEVAESTRGSASR